MAKNLCIHLPRLLVVERVFVCNFIKWQNHVQHIVAVSFTYIFVIPSNSYQWNRCASSAYRCTLYFGIHSNSHTHNVISSGMYSMEMSLFRFFGFSSAIVCTAVLCWCHSTDECDCTTITATTCKWTQFVDETRLRITYSNLLR